MQRISVLGFVIAFAAAGGVKAGGFSSDLAFPNGATTLPVIYGSAYAGAGNGGGAGPATLYSISPATGAATAIGLIGFNGVGAMAFDRRGILYGIGKNGSAWVLLTINTSTGAGTVVGPLGDSSISAIEDMDFRPSDGTLFALGATATVNDTLYTINTVTGQSTLIGQGNSSFSTDGDGLAFNSSNVLFNVNQLELDMTNQADGTRSRAVSLTYNSSFGAGESRGDAMKFDPATGILWTSVVNGNGPAAQSNYLGIIDLVAGTVNFVGPTIHGLDALAIANSMLVSSLPHVADGNNFKTEVLLINTGTTNANYGLQFFNQSGAQVSYPLDSTQSGMTGAIPAGGQVIVRTAGSGATTNLGWGQLIAPPSIQGMLIYQQQASPTSLQEGSAPIIGPRQHFFVPFDNANGAITSVGFENPGSAAATVNFTIRYASGGTDMVPVLTMNPSQQIAETVTTLWASTAGQRGMIEVNASAPIGMVAFRFQGSAFTLIDTIAPTAGGSTAVTSTIAHSADGNNFKSTFLLTNTGTSAAPYALAIFGSTGQAQTFGFGVANPLSGMVPPGSTLTIDTTGLGGVTNLGWAQLTAPPAVGGIEIFRQTNPGQSEQQATIPISQTNLSHVFLPFDNTGNTTSIALANPDPANAATINVTFRYSDGTSNTGQLTMQPRNYIANLIAGLFPATSGKAGVAEFTSNVGIAVVEVRFNPTQAFTSLRAVGP